MKLIITGIVTVLSLLSNNYTDLGYTSVEVNQENTLAESVAKGKVIYEEFCVRCHKATGEGKGKFYPPLAGSDWLTTKRNESIKAVKFGLKGLIIVNGKEYKRSMSNPGLENNEIANVMNYVMNSWGNTQEQMVTPEEVSNIQP